jgi:hypothetical protein
MAVWELVAVAALMLGVFVDMSYVLGHSNPSPARNPSRVSGVLGRLAEAPFSDAATQPRSHAAIGLA